MRATDLEKKLIPWILAGTLFATHLVSVARDHWDELRPAEPETVVQAPIPPLVPGL